MSKDTQHGKGFWYELRLSHIVLVATLLYVGYTAWLYMYFSTGYPWNNLIPFEFHKGALIALITYPVWLITAAISNLTTNVFLGRYRLHRFVVVIEIVLSVLSLTSWLIALVWSYLAMGLAATG